MSGRGKDTGGGRWGLIGEVRIDKVGVRGVVGGGEG